MSTFFILNERGALSSFESRAWSNSDKPSSVLWIISSFYKGTTKLQTTTTFQWFSTKGNARFLAECIKHHHIIVDYIIEMRRQFFGERNMKFLIEFVHFITDAKTAKFGRAKIE